jgi:Mn2+/Fe2+ NRAMP family transporter
MVSYRNIMQWLDSHGCRYDRKTMSLGGYLATSVAVLSGVKRSERIFSVQRLFSSVNSIMIATLSSVVAAPETSRVTLENGGRLLLEDASFVNLSY